MSRGLGRVEKKILEFLNDKQITKDMGVEYRHVSDIVEYVYDIEYPYCERNKDTPDDTEFFDLIKKDGAPYQSVCRALRRLEHPPKHRKKLIKSKWKDVRDYYYDKYGDEKEKYYRYKVIYPVKSKS